jgi:hypothetical protein
MWAIDYPYQPTAPAVSFIESAPRSEDSPRTVTSCASGVQTFTQAFASWRLKASVVAAITASMSSSSLEATEREV